MAMIQGFSSSGRPEMGDGGPTYKEVAALQRSLNRAYSKKDHSSQGSFVNVWMGHGEMVISAEIPNFSAEEIEISIEGLDLRIHAHHAKTPSFNRLIKLPFSPDPATIHARFAEGMLFIHLDEKTSS